MGSDGYRRRFERAARDLPTGATADARFAEGSWTTIRFANGAVHQPHFERVQHLSIRVAVEGRLGTATSSDLSPAGLGAAARAALSMAREAPVEPTFAGFPDDDERVAPTAYSASTARMGPEAVTRLTSRLIDTVEAHSPGGRIAGAVHVGSDRLTVVNSAGLLRSSATSAAQASLLVDRPDVDPPPSGWAEGAHWDANRLDVERLGREAAERMPVRPVESIAPGAYPVVLAGPAVSEALGFLAHLGFGGHAEAEGWSCFGRSRGKRVAPPSVTLLDDPRSASSIPRAIDNEGTRTRRTPLIAEGVARAAVTDLLTGARLGRPRTGHALPPEAPWGEWGPVPSHLLLGAGDERDEELVKNLRRGLLVTRFHYVRVVDPGRAVLTGMTRDGTYRVEKGEVVAPVRNLRFTESLLTLLKGVDGLGRERRIYADERGTTAVTTPALRARSFRFTSATLF